jgi:hypothetical protein
MMNRGKLVYSTDFFPLLAHPLWMKLHVQKVSVCPSHTTVCVEQKQGATRGWRRDERRVFVNTLLIQELLWTCP